MINGSENLSIKFTQSFDFQEQEGQANYIFLQQTLILSLKFAINNPFFIIEFLNKNNSG
ncbi:MAG: hypothetical protein NPMRIOTA_400008 [Nitrosopumilales archaeon]|nr:MAG: hypothetical protein NPMRIOTA_400008 [Nitrosopumilales archaeon]